MRLRQRVKEEFKAREGVSLSPFVFLCRAAVLAIRNHPVINAFADWEAGKVTYHDYVNLGIAVDTERGLLVPNIKGADDLNLAGLGRAISEAAAKARGKGKLEMQDIEGGTFTVTNIGSVDVLIDTPILNYPEVAILGTGAVRKRPMVLEGENGPTIGIRDMAYLCLTYDHRLIDGADAARYVSEVREVAETHDWAGEIGYGA
jgi:2-oxoglutarate dehydrogenase E2 component (dihydrolipoamide succinyltransferase)